MEKNINISINEDFFAKKFQKLDKDLQDIYVHYLFSIGSSAQDYADEGKLSRITANRVRRGCHRLYWHGKELPSETKKKFTDKGYQWRGVNFLFFKKAMEKFWRVLKQDKNKKLKYWIKFWEKTRIECQRRRDK